MELLIDTQPLDADAETTVIEPVEEDEDDESAAPVAADEDDETLVADGADEDEAAEPDDEDKISASFNLRRPRKAQVTDDERYHTRKAQIIAAAEAWLTGQNIAFERVQFVAFEKRGSRFDGLCYFYTDGVDGEGAIARTVRVKLPVAA